MSEALEKWDINLLTDVIPDVVEIIKNIDARLVADLTAKGLNVPVECECACAKADAKKEKEPVKTKLDGMRIIDGNLVHMARLAVYASSYTNGVAWIHTEILKDDVLKDWYAIYPRKIPEQDKRCYTASLAWTLQPTAF